MSSHLDKVFDPIQKLTVDITLNGSFCVVAMIGILGYLKNLKTRLVLTGILKNKLPYF
jgi:hypothetical protein